MSREIKFRAWWKNEMHYDIRISGGSSLIEDWMAMSDDKPVYMQFTGMKDKNGKEVYEGDICEWDDTSKSKLVIIWGETEGCWCYYYLGKWGNPKSIYPLCLETDSEWQYGGFAGCDLVIKNHISKVIGNVYENPELIK